MAVVGNMWMAKMHDVHAIIVPAVFVLFRIRAPLFL